ncbi:MAG: hypothetical protein R3C14_54140 [Caldilineaceae bacterium]
MAYTLSDPFRALRFLLRINGVVIGLLMGLLLLLASRPALMAWGLYSDGALWPLRLAGSGHIALGLFFILTANQDYISRALLLTTMLANALSALVIMSGYLQQEFSGLPPVGRIILILIVLLSLMGAVLPLRYVRNDMR